MLEMVLDIYRSGGRVRRSLARSLLKLSPVVPESASRLARLINGVPRKPGHLSYDGVVLYSGGKDSSYMLQNLARRGLELCAWMLDHSYQSPTALENAS